MALYDLSNEFQRLQFEARAKKLTESHAIVELTEKKPHRTLPQNRYLHLLLSYLASELGETAEHVKRYYYKIAVNSEIFIREKDDAFLGKIKVLRSSAELSTDEMTTSIERLRNWASSEAGIYLPSADEQRLISQMEIEIHRNRNFI